MCCQLHRHLFTLEQDSQKDVAEDACDLLKTSENDNQWIAYKFEILSDIDVKTQLNPLAAIFQPKLQATVLADENSASEKLQRKTETLNDLAVVIGPAVEAAESSGYEAGSRNLYSMSLSDMASRASVSSPYFDTCCDCQIMLIKAPIHLIL